MIIAIIILSVLLVISTFININLLRKIEKLDEELTNTSITMEDFYNSLQVTKSKMKEIDSKGWFEKDDETGTVFKGIDEVLNELYKTWEITDEN